MVTRAAAKGPRASAIATGLVLVAISSAAAQPKTWTLWRESKTTVNELRKEPRVGDVVEPISKPSETTTRSETVIEEDLDRAACELVRQTKINGAHTEVRRGPFQFSLFEDGTMVHWLKRRADGVLEMTTYFEKFICLAAGKKPSDTWDKK